MEKQLCLHLDQNRITQIFYVKSFINLRLVSLRGRALICDSGLLNTRIRNPFRRGIVKIQKIRFKRATRREKQPSSLPLPPTPAPPKKPSQN